jgi:hypothetical protein
MRARLISMLNISLPLANALYNGANGLLILGAFFVLLGTIVAIWSGGIRERFANERLSNNEVATATAKADAARANERAAEATLKLMQADANLLSEQRLTARERMRLERLERAVLPRGLLPQQYSALVPKLKGLGPINIAIIERQEPRNFGLQLVQLFQDAGIMGRLLSLPQESQQSGVVMYAADEHGRRAAEILWRNAGIAGATLGGGITPVGLGTIPKNEDTLIVGDNDAAFQPTPGQPGEGLDERGRPVPAPR